MSSRRLQSSRAATVTRNFFAGGRSESSRRSSPAPSKPTCAAPPSAGDARRLRRRAAARVAEDRGRRGGALDGGRAAQRGSRRAGGSGRPGMPSRGDVLVVRPVASPADRRARDGAARRRAGFLPRARERDGASDGARGEGVAVCARGRRGRGAQQVVRAGETRAERGWANRAPARGSFDSPERSRRRRRRRRSSSCPARTSARPVSSSARSSGWRSAPRPACPCRERPGMGKGITGGR